VLEQLWKHTQSQKQGSAMSFFQPPQGIPAVLTPTSGTVWQGAGTQPALSQ